MVARGRVDQAGAGLHPQVAGTASYQRQSGNIAPRPGSTPVGLASSWNWTTYNYFNFGLSGSQLLYDFGQTADRTRSAEASLDSTRAAQRTTEVSVVLAVRRAFFAAKAQRSLARVAEETLGNQQRHLVQIQGFVASGTRPEIDLSQAKSDVATARVQLIVAQNNYEVARAQLDQAMGAPGGAEYEVADDEMSPIAEEDQGTEPLVQRALSSRPEFAAFESQRRASELSIKAIRSYQYAPTLAATASLTDSGTSLGGLVPNWSVGAQLTWPILVGGLAQGQITEAEGNLALVQAQVDTTRLQVRFDVEQARVGVKGAKATIGASQEALVNARDRLRLAEGRYQAGVGNIIELGDAQLAVASAAAQLVQAQYNLATARAQLLAALGRR
jgi:outer membrane protein